MARIIYDLVNPEELQGFVRNLQFPEFGLSAWLPDVAIDDIEFRWHAARVGDLDVAPFRAWDTPSPWGDRPGITRVRGELAPVSRAMPLGEEQTLRLRALEGARGFTPQLIRQVFADTLRLARAVYGRLELAKGEAIFEGTTTIDENGLGVGSIDQGYTSANFVDMNSGSYAGAYLTDPTSDAIGFLEQLLEEYNRRTNGLVPGAILAPRRFRTLLQRNQQFIRAAYRGAAVDPASISRAQLQEVFDDYDIPPITFYDVALPVNGVNTRVTPPNKFALLPAVGAPSDATMPSTVALDPTEVAPSLGRCFWGPTAEAIELANANQIAAELAPGITAVNLKEDFPVYTGTNVVGVSFPVIGNPDEVTIATFAAA